MDFTREPKINQKSYNEFLRCTFKNGSFTKRNLKKLNAIKSGEPFYLEANFLKSEIKRKL